MSEFWNELKRQGIQGRDELFRAMYPDWPSGMSGFQPGKDLSPSAGELKHELSTLDERLQDATHRQDIDRDDPEPERE